MHKNVIKILCMKSFLLKFISSLETFAIKKIRKVVLIYGQYDNCKTIQISDVKKMCFVVGLFSVGIIFYIRHLTSNKTAKYQHIISISYSKNQFIDIIKHKILNLYNLIGYDIISCKILAITFYSFMYFFFKMLLLIG